MGWEDIESPWTEVDRLYRAIVVDYKAGKYSSQDEALAILECQYFASYIEIKNEISFEGYSFYRHGRLPNIDEYISVCEKSEISPSPKECDIYVQIIDEIIKNYQAASEVGDDPEFVLSYSDAAATVYREVNEVRKLCCKNRKTKKLYDKYKAEIEGYFSLDIKSPIEPPVVIKTMIGKVLKNIKDEKGRYLPEDGYNDLKIIAWIFNESGYEDEITSQIYCQYIATKVKNNTIERYFSNARNEAK